MSRWLIETTEPQSAQRKPQTRPLRKKGATLASRSLEVFTVAVLPRDFEGEVDNAWASTCSCDTSEAGRVKVVTVIDEVRMVQHIDERRLQFGLHSFSDRNAFHETGVDVKECRSVE